MLIRALLVEDDPDFAGLVHLWLSSRSGSVHFDLTWRATLGSALLFEERGGSGHLNS